MFTQPQTAKYLSEKGGNQLQRLGKVTFRWTLQFMVVGQTLQSIAGMRRKNRNSNKYGYGVLHMLSLFGNVVAVNMFAGF